MSIEGIGGEAAPTNASSTAPDYTNVNLFSTGEEGSNEESGNPSAPSAPVPSPSDIDRSKRLEFLSKKERDLLSREKKFKEEISKYKDLEERLKKYEQIDEIAPSDPLALLDKYGWDMEKLTNHVMNRNDGLSFKEKNTLMEKIENMEKRFQAQEEKEKNEIRNQTYNHYVNDLKEVAKTDPNRWELVASENAYDMAFQAADKIYREKKVMVDPEELLDFVESYIDQQYSRGLKYKKVQSKFGKNSPNVDSSEGDYQQTKPQQSYEPRTLTNNFAPTAPSNSKQFMTPEESKARLAKMLGNSLWEE